MLLRVIVLISYLFVVFAQAEDNTTNQTMEEYIDEKQKVFSKKVVNFFDSVDQSISQLAKPEETMTCDELEEQLNNDFFKEQGSIDAFFKSDKFIDETEASFVRLRLGSIFQTKESADFSYKIRAQIPLSRTKKSFQLFIDDVEKNYFQSTAPVETTKSTNTEVGVRYLAPDYKDIKSKYSIGMSSLVGYARARYSKEFKFENWLIVPTQQFKYSLESDWSEETNIYFDRALEENSIFRTTLHRKTQAHIDGFDYALGLSYYLTLSNRKGFSFTQQFWGNSKYVCDEHPSRYDGISDYSSFLSWRQNIFRKWITYEVQPGISFHRQYDYEPNFVLRFYVDFYFGNIDSL